MRAAAVVAAAVLAAAPVVAAPPAHAEGELGLSLDGSTWTGSLSGPLFDPATTWVPGDVQTARFYVRNQAADAGDLVVGVSSLDQGLAADADHLRVEARVGAGAWSDPSALTPAHELAPGARVPVEVRLAMSPDAPNDSMVRTTDVDVVVRLVQSDAGAPAGAPAHLGGADPVDPAEGAGEPVVIGEVKPGAPHTDNHDDVLLPATGSSVPGWLLPMSLLLLGLGGVLLGWRRRDLERPLQVDPS